MSHHSRRTILKGMGATVGVASLTAAEAVAEGVVVPRYIVEMPKGILLLTEDEDEHLAAWDALEGVFGERRLLEMGGARFPAPKPNEVLWVWCEDCDSSLMEEVQEVMENLLLEAAPVECGPMISSNFEAEITSMSREELEMLRETIDVLLDTDLPREPKVGISKGRTA